MEICIRRNNLTHPTDISIFTITPIEKTLVNGKKTLFNTVFYENGWF